MSGASILMTGAGKGPKEGLFQILSKDVRSSFAWASLFLVLCFSVLGPSKPTTTAD